MELRMTKKQQSFRSRTAAMQARSAAEIQQFCNDFRCAGRRAFTEATPSKCQYRPKTGQ